MSHIVNLAQGAFIKAISATAFFPSSTNEEDDENNLLNGLDPLHDGEPFPPGTLLHKIRVFVAKVSPCTELTSSFSPITT